MIKKTFLTTVLAASTLAMTAQQTSKSGLASMMAKTYDLQEVSRGLTPIYTDNTGYGYDINAESWKDGDSFFYSVKVPDGNYRVTMELGSRHHAAATTVRAESRRLMIENCMTRKKEIKTVSFTVNKRSPYINGKTRVRIKEREKGSRTWDDRLTFEFSGQQPAVKSITIEPDTTATTIFLCGNSTVVDQNSDMYASWGQMVTRWFGTDIAISNHAESGLTAGSFLSSGRLDKILTMMRSGDYVLCEFGHNDQKEKYTGFGAWYNFQYNLKRFIDQVREKGGNIIFATPTQRRRWDESRTHIVETHGDYPAAVRDIARRENVPVIELHDMTRTFFETLGYEGSKKALVHYSANTFPGQKKALADNTHFNPYGAYEVAKMVIMEMKRLDIAPIKGLKDDWKDFSPSHPDNPDTFKWLSAPMQDTAKPDGD